MAPRVGVIIPVYKHPKLVTEAISSAILQNDAAGFIICIVNDGCPLAETDEVLRSWATAYPSQISVIKTPNAGLSAARNAGIQFLMKVHPELEAAFFLDADNLLDVNAASTFSHLLDQYPAVDWFYPQFDMFGLDAMKSAGGDYSLLRQSLVNSCEAGSLVRRRVFEAGVRYDETMRLGYEDWDFWLTAASKHFRGQPFEQPVFLYRKRPESMLAGSHSHDAEIRGYMRRKHSWLYSQQAIALEHREAPRYRIFLTAATGVLCATDPLAPEETLSFEELVRQYWHSVHDPEKCGSGHLWVFAGHAAWNALRDAGVLRFTLWDLERRSGVDTVSVAFVDIKDTQQFRYEDCNTQGYALDSCAIAAIPTALVNSLMAGHENDPSKSLELVLSYERVSSVRMTVPSKVHAIVGARSLSQTSALHPSVAGDPQGEDAVRRLADTVISVSLSPYRTQHYTDGWRRVSWLPPRNDGVYWTRKALDCNVVYPSLSYFEGRPTVCFLLTIAEFGGVETVTANVAKTLHTAGFRTALCMIGTRPITLIDGLDSVFDEILWFPDDSLRESTGPIYEGTYLPTEPPHQKAKELVGLLVSFNVVISCHGGGSVAVLSTLRKHGVVTGLYEHVLDTGAYGRTFGTPIVALAYEAAVDFILTCSDGLGDWFTDHGVPDSKVIRVPNAAGYPLDAAALGSMQPRSAESGAPLRILFLGRFDRQKGMDRLADIIEGVYHESIDVDWKVHGTSILDGDRTDEERLSQLVNVSPPVTSIAGKTDLLKWADVLLIPSRFEGLPLTILEAQRCGAVPLVARCGMVEEAVENGLDGFLVSQEHCVEEMIEYIRRLSRDRGILNQLSRHALAKDVRWEDRLQPLLSVLAERL